VRGRGGEGEGERAKGPGPGYSVILPGLPRTIPIPGGGSLATLGKLLGAMRSTRTEWEAAVATAGDGVQTDRSGFHTILQCKATRSALKVDMNKPGFVSDVRVCVSVPWGSARVAVHLTPRLPLLGFLKNILWIHLSSPRLSACVHCGCCVPSCPHFLRTYALARQLRLTNLRQLPTNEGEGDAAVIHAARCLWLIDGPLPCSCTECPRSRLFLCYAVTHLFVLWSWVHGTDVRHDSLDIAIEVRYCVVGA
jgi:ferredoxin